MLRKATMCPAFFPAGFNWTDEISRRMISSRKAGHDSKKIKCDERAMKIKKVGVPV